MLNYYSTNSTFTINGKYYDDSKQCIYDTVSDTLSILAMVFNNDGNLTDTELVILENFSYNHNLENLIDEQLLIPKTNVIKTNADNIIKFN